MISVLCQCGHKLHSNREVTVRCPVCRVPVFISEQATQYKWTTPSMIWRMLHRYAIENQHDWNPPKAMAWYFNQFLPLVPSHLPSGDTCGCQSHWTELTKEYPIKFDTAEEFEYSTWLLHSLVSEKHSHARLLTFEQSQKLWRSPRVGFWSTTYQRVGGTETWHQILLTELRHRVQVIGFWANELNGDPKLLNVPVWSDPAELAAAVDVLVVWGVDDIANRLKGASPVVINVHHADTRSAWSDSLQFQENICGVVCVNSEVPEHLRNLGLKVPALYIPNPVNLEVGQAESFDCSEKIVFWPHRDSAEKQPILARRVAKHLPDGWKMAMTAYGEDNSKLIHLGPVDAGKYTRNAACVLSLATFEGFGYSIAEAMIAGVPVVSYKRGIANEHNSTLIPEDATPEQIAALCVKATPKPHNLEQNCSTSVAEQWAELIEQLNQRQRRISVDWLERA